MPSTLHGKNILLTREKASSELMAHDIQALGGNPIILPVMKIIHNKLSHTEYAIMMQAHRFDWIVFTSPNGVKAFINNVKSLNIKLTNTKIAVVGKKTAQVASVLGLNVDLIPDEFTAGCLAERLAENGTKRGSILLPLGNLAKSDIEVLLNNAGFQTTRINVYSTVINGEIQQELQKLVQDQTIDVVTFASPSAINFFLSMTNHLDLNDFWKRSVVACIGKVSANYARKNGLNPQIVPNTYTANALIKSIADFFSAT